MSVHYQKMLASGRRSGAVGSAPTILTKYAIQNMKRDNTLILDFGAGKFRHQTKHMRLAGFDVYPFDFWENMEDYPSCEVKREDVGRYIANKKHSYKRVVAIMSNVLNVQDNYFNLWYCIKEAFDLGATVCYANYPESPRYSGLSFNEVYEWLKEYYRVQIMHVNLVGNNRSNKHKIMRITERYK